ncbi:MAG: hypothetical protein ACNA8P_11760, partial [Phycisphaerales bacterium]
MRRKVREVERRLTRICHNFKFFSWRINGERYSGSMIKISPIVTMAICLSAVSTSAIAQWSGISDTYLPLAEPGEPIPEFNIGELHLQVDGWDIIPIYSLVEKADAQPHERPWEVRVRGIFFATDPVATKGEDLRAVWYQRPDDPKRGHWTASTWSTGSLSVAEAAFSVKTNLKIPDIQDQLWAIDDLEFVKLEQAIPFAVRIIAGDSKAAPIDAREENEPSPVESYPLAGVPIEAGDIERLHVNLEHLARTFETVIMTRSWDSVGNRVLWPHSMDQDLKPPATP